MNKDEKNAMKTNAAITKQANYYCWWFVQFFHKSFVLNQKASKVRDEIVDVYNISDNKLKENIEKVFTILKEKFNKLLFYFWNHETFLKLIHKTKPLETLVQDEKDGFEYLLNILSAEILKVLFHDESELSNVTFESYSDSSHNYQLGEIYLIKVEGID